MEESPDLDTGPGSPIGDRTATRAIDTPNRVSDTTDLEKDRVKISSQEIATPAPPVKDYDLDRKREGWRGVIALWLLALLTLTVLFAFAIFWTNPQDLGNLKDLLAIIFGPIAALVGAATGYYFGASANR